MKIPAWIIRLARLVWPYLIDESTVFIPVTARRWMLVSGEVIDIDMVFCQLGGRSLTLYMHQRRAERVIYLYGAEFIGLTVCKDWSARDAR